MKEAHLNKVKYGIIHFSGRLGIIFSNFSVLIILVYLFSAIANFSSAFALVFGLILIIITLGLILVAFPNYFENLTEFTKNVMETSQIILKNWYYFSAAILGLAVLSFILLSIDTFSSHKGRKIFCFIEMTLGIISIALFLGGIL